MGLTDLENKTKVLKQRPTIPLFMDKRDAVVLAGILIGVAIPVFLVSLVANGIVDNPIP